MQSPGQISIIVPAYNEQLTILHVINRLLQLKDLLEIIVVDDCSKDQTNALVSEFALQHPQVTLLKHEKNAGKTEALKTGFAASRGDIVLVQDADLEYDPGDIPSIVSLIINGEADVVYGSRFLVRKAARVLYFYHYLANKGLTFMSNLFTNVNLTDVETGYKAFRGEIIRNMVINSEGFGFEIEVTAKISKLKCAIYEVPISYYGRTYEEGKKIGPMDGVAAIWYILYYNLFVNPEKSFRNYPFVQETLAQRMASRHLVEHLAQSDAE
jgi:glycosyltransferase involved in cell wall biosynthesis